MKIRDLGQEYILISESREIATLAETLGLMDLQDCNGLFIKLSSAGDSVEEVYGFEGIVPLWDKQVTRLFPCEEDEDEKA